LWQVGACLEGTCRMSDPRSLRVGAWCGLRDTWCGLSRTPREALATASEFFTSSERARHPGLCGPLFLLDLFRVILWKLCL